MSFTSSALPSLRASTTQCESGRLHSSPSPQKCNGLFAGRNTSAIRMPRVQKAMQYLHHSRVLQASLLNSRFQHLCLTRRVQPRESQHETTDFWDRRMDNLGSGKEGSKFFIGQHQWRLSSLFLWPHFAQHQCSEDQDNVWERPVLSCEIISGKSLGLPCREA